MALPALLGTLADGFRASFLRRPRRRSGLLPTDHFWWLALLWTLWTCFWVWFEIEAPRRFYIDGAQTMAVDVLAQLLAAWLAALVIGRRDYWWTLATALIAANLAFCVLISPLRILADELSGAGAIHHWYWLQIAVYVWWLLIVLRLLLPLARAKRITGLIASLLVYATTLFTSLALNPIRFWYADEQVEAEPDSEDLAADFDPEATMYQQAERVAAALAQVQAQRPGKTDLYLLAFGGDGDEDVFRNEVEFVERLFTTRFAARGRTLALINNPNTVETRPLATLTNLRLALTGLSERMDAEEDILFLFLTTHGSEQHQLYVGLQDLALNQIDAATLAEVVHAAPMRWKVIVVSACYAGGYIDTLKNATTMVIAAASHDKTSFGCGAESEITYFGRAFFAEALNEVDSFSGAFERAKTHIAELEDAADLERSEPQIVSSPLIEAKLRTWRDAIQLGPPLPFEPAPGGATNTADGDADSDYGP